MGTRDGASARSTNETCDWVQAHAALSRLSRQRAALDAEEGRGLLRAWRSAVHVHLGYGSFAQYVESLFGYKPGTIQEKLRVAEALEGLPRLTRALEAGALSWCAARELTRVALSNTESAWLDAARGRTLRELEALVASKAPGDTPDAPASELPRPRVLRFEVAADTFATFREAVQQLQRSAGGRLDDDALLLALARHVLGGPRDEGRSSYQISLHVCSACGSGAQPAAGELVPVDAAVVDMAACDAQDLGKLLPLAAAPQAANENALASANAEGRQGAADASGDERTATRQRSGHVHMGAPNPHARPRPRRPRAQQSIPPALRRAVLARDRRRCRVPGCTHAAFMDVHHVQPRAEGGRHEAENLLTLCGAHHRAAHRGELLIERDHDGAVVFRHADGSAYGSPTAPRLIDAHAKVFSALRHLGFREGEVKTVLSELRADAALDGAPLESLLRWDESGEEPIAAMPIAIQKRATERRSSAPVTAVASRDGDGLPTDKRRAGRGPKPSADETASTSASKGGSRKKVVALPPPGKVPDSAPTRSKTQLNQGAQGRTTMRKVALDLGVKKTTYCEIFEGKVVRRGTVSELESLRSLLGPDQPRARVAIEACREAWFVHDLLIEWGNEVVVVDTTRSKQLGIGQHGRKTDRIDAEVLARALERGGIPVAHVLSPARRELRRVLGVRRALVESRANLVTTVRGLVREQGVKLASCTTPHFARRVREQKLAAEMVILIEPLLVLIEGIDAQVTRVETQLEQLCAQEPVIALLTTTPGVGAIVAAAFVAVVDEAKRFRSAHQLESYVGLVPKEDTTGGKRRLGAISKQGNSYLRALLVQSAWVILRKSDPDDPLRLWATQLVERRGKRIAAVALARRLVGVLWAMWRDGTVYDAKHLTEQGIRGLRGAVQTLDQQTIALAKAATKASVKRRAVGGTSTPRRASKIAAATAARS